MFFRRFMRLTIIANTQCDLLINRNSE